MRTIITKINENVRMANQFHTRKNTKKIRLLCVSWLSIGLFSTVYFPLCNESKTFTFSCSNSIRTNHLSFEITITLILSKSHMPNVQIRSLTSIYLAAPWFNHFLPPHCSIEMCTHNFCTVDAYCPKSCFGDAKT